MQDYTRAKKVPEATALEQKLKELHGEDTYPVVEHHASYRDDSKATVVLNADNSFYHVRPDGHEVRGTREPKANVKDVMVLRCGEFVEEWQTLPGQYVILRWSPPETYPKGKPVLAGSAAKE